MSCECFWSLRLQIQAHMSKNKKQQEHFSFDLSKKRKVHNIDFIVSSLFLLSWLKILYRTSIAFSKVVNVLHTSDPWLLICVSLGGRDDVQHRPSRLSATGQGASG